jgi:hypothetical protein
LGRRNAEPWIVKTVSCSFWLTVAAGRLRLKKSLQRFVLRGVDPIARDFNVS